MSDLDAENTLIVEYWFRICKQSESAICIKDIIQIIIEFANKLDILCFSTEFKSQNIQLLDDNKCAMKSHELGCNVYVLVDDDPAKSGIHVWRLQVLSNKFKCAF